MYIAKISGTHKDPSTGSTFFEITIYHRRADDVDIQWTISRRYSEFDTLRGRLCTDGIPARNFPPKVWGSHSDSVLDKRKELLTVFLDEVVLQNLSNEAAAAFIELDEHDPNQAPSPPTHALPYVLSPMGQASNSLNQTLPLFGTAETRQAVEAAATQSELGQAFHSPPSLGSQASQLTPKNYFHSAPAALNRSAPPRTSSERRHTAVASGHGNSGVVPLDWQPPPVTTLTPKSQQQCASGKAHQGTPRSQLADSPAAPRSQLAELLVTPKEVLVPQTESVESLRAQLAEERDANQQLRAEVEIAQRNDSQCVVDSQKLEKQLAALQTEVFEARTASNAASVGWKMAETEIERLNLEIKRLNVCLSKATNFLRQDSHLTPRAKKPNKEPQTTRHTVQASSDGSPRNQRSF